MKFILSFFNINTIAVFMLENIGAVNPSLLIALKKNLYNFNVRKKVWELKQPRKPSHKKQGGPGNE